MNGSVVEILHSDAEGVIFQVQSGSSPKEFHTLGYDHRDGWCCTCENYRYRRTWCRHMSACVEYAEEQGISITDDHVYGQKVIV